MTVGQGNHDNNRFVRRADMLIKDRNFGFYLDWFRTKKQGVKVDYGTHQEQDRQDAILKACGISSLAELDQKESGQMMFWRIEREFRQWQVNQARKHETRRR